MSIYGATKLLAHRQVETSRGNGVFATSGILFNHESPRRASQFVSKKIAHHVAAIRFGKLKSLELDNLDSRRDWGYAPDYVRAMHLIVQTELPNDFVIGTGQSHTVRDFVDAAFTAVGLNWRDYVIELRPGTHDGLPLMADARRAEEVLGWKPTVGFEEMVSLMVEAESHRLETGPED